MRLANYALPDEIFIDANIWSYFALRNPTYQSECTRFLERVEQSQVHAATSNFVLNEVVHVILIGKGSELLKTDKIARIKKQLKEDSRLSTECYKACREFMDYVRVLQAKGLNLIDVGSDVIVTSLDIGKNYRLLATDALHVATCSTHNIKHVATNDSDFDGVDFLTVYKPEFESASLA